MIKQYAGFHSQALSSKPEPLPAGVYEAAIQGARVEDTPWGGQRLILALDVTAGEHAGHYKKLFDWEQANGSYTPKFKGTFRINIPSGDGSEKDAWTKRLFEGAIWSIEQSNPGYKFDFNETALKGKAIGINVRNKEWEYNDMSGWTTEIGRLETIADVKSGRVKPMRDKALEKHLNDGSIPAGATDVTASVQEDLPF